LILSPDFQEENACFAHPQRTTVDEGAGTGGKRPQVSVSKKPDFMTNTWVFSTLWLTASFEQIFY